MTGAWIHHLPFFAAGWIFLIGLYGATTSRHLVHLCLCLSVIQTSTYVIFLAIGYRAGGAAPVFVKVLPGTRAVDPVIQALMLTDVVVEATVIALLLALVVQVHKRTGTTDPNGMKALYG